MENNKFSFLDHPAEEIITTVYPNEFFNELSDINDLPIEFAEKIDIVLSAWAVTVISRSFDILGIVEQINLCAEAMRINFFINNDLISVFPSKDDYYQRWKTLRTMLEKRRENLNRQIDPLKKHMRDDTLFFLRSEVFKNILKKDVTQMQISKLMGFNLSDVNAILDDLEKIGYVDRSRRTTNTVVSLTLAGKNFFNLLENK